MSEAPLPLLNVQNLSKRFGGFSALTDVSFHLLRGERLGLIGPNGSGKTTMINCISGVLSNESGTILFRGENINRLTPPQRARLGIARSFQIPRPFTSMTVLQNLKIALEYAAHDRADQAHIDNEAMKILQQIDLADRANHNSAGLTQIELRKLELARALAAKPSLLVADEAMAGLSSSEVDEILAILLKLNEQGVAVIMIEHIMRAVMQFCQRIVVLDAGRKIADALPAEVVSNPDVERAYLGE
jgi:branched-chain amino acid transport system ATP-binding protein